MVRATDAPQDTAEPLSGFPTARTPLVERGSGGPGWRMPRPRAPGNGTVAAYGPWPAPSLTDRDRELIRHLANGSSTAQIAAATSVSSNTARTRIRRISGKLGVLDRRAIVPAAHVRGLV